MPLRDDLQRWAAEFAGAKRQEFSGSLFGNWVRSSLPQSTLDAIGPAAQGLIADGSVGVGKWAAVSWTALFEPSVTTSATTGFYVVYLLSTDAETLHLSLNQGATRVQAEFKSKANGVLKQRASLIRQRLDDYISLLPDISIELGDRGRLPTGYEAGHAMGRTYSTAALPGETELASDLMAAIGAYRALIYRGGVDLDGDVADDDVPLSATIEERRRYRLHRSIERNPRAGKLAKGHHGYKCQCCGFDFELRYGLLGHEFIEAHHLKPISSIKEGEVVTYEVADDFAVLCSNCHRMIHRMPDVGDVAALRKLLVPPPT